MLFLVDLAQYIEKIRAQGDKGGPHMKGRRILHYKLNARLRGYHDWVMYWCRLLSGLTPKEIVQMLVHHSSL